MNDNKLIAEFMGIECGDYITPHYHCNWEELIKVVAKITRNEKYLGNDYREHLMDVVPYGYVEDTYDAVVEFIKEYNKIKN
tara:strand:+ start:306 stop:548 length:243 start_codon:yes stop_codon:yes gene_type:complete